MRGIGLRSRLALAVAALVLLGAGSGWSQQHKGERASQRLEALVKLAPPQRAQYLQGQRALEETRHRDRLEQLDRAQSCLAAAATAPALKACWQALLTTAQTQRQSQLQEQRALDQRLGLPAGQKAR